LQLWENISQLVPRQMLSYQQRHSVSPFAWVNALRGGLHWPAVTSVATGLQLRRGPAGSGKGMSRFSLSRNCTSCNTATLSQPCSTLWCGLLGSCLATQPAALGWDSESGFLSRAQPPAHPMALGKGWKSILYFLSGN